MNRATKASPAARGLGVGEARHAEMGMEMPAVRAVRDLGRDHHPGDPAAAPDALPRRSATGSGEGFRDEPFEVRQAVGRAVRNGNEPHDKRSAALGRGLHDALDSRLPDRGDGGGAGWAEPAGAAPVDPGDVGAGGAVGASAAPVGSDLLDIVAGAPATADGRAALVGGKADAEHAGDAREEVPTAARRGRCGGSLPVPLRFGGGGRRALLRLAGERGGEWNSSVGKAGPRGPADGSSRCGDGGAGVRGRRGGEGLEEGKGGSRSRAVDRLARAAGEALGGARLRGRASVDHRGVEARGDPALGGAVGRQNLLTRLGWGGCRLAGSMSQPGGHSLSPLTAYVPIGIIAPPTRDPRERLQAR